MFTPYLGNRQITISLPMQANKAIQLFQYQPNLQKQSEDIQIKSIETYGSTIIPADPNDTTLALAAVIQNSFLVLKKKEEEQFKYMPLLSLAPQFNGYKYRELDLVNIQWEKSYILVNTTGIASIVAGNVFFLNISYNKGPQGSFNG